MKKINNSNVSNYQQARPTFLGEYIGGGCAILIGLFMGLSVVSVGIPGIYGVILFLGIGILPLLVGVKILWDSINRKRHIIENVLIELATKHNGRLNATILVRESYFSLEEADNLLKYMLRKGYVDMEIDDRGVTNYLFRSFVSR